MLVVRPVLSTPGPAVPPSAGPQHDRWQAHHGGMTTVEMDFHTALIQLFAPYTVADGTAIHVTVIHDFGCGARVEVDAMLKPLKLAEQSTPHQVRTAMMESANRAIDTVEAFGFRMFDAPRIDFGGQLLRRGTKGALVVTEGRLRLSLFPPTAEAEA